MLRTRLFRPRTLRYSGFPTPIRQLSGTSVVCSGHNKWSKIKDKKGANDLQKSLLYTKINNDIMNAARMGGSADPAQNAQLATVVKKAKELAVPKENIEKALARAAGSKDGTGSRMVYEALAYDSVGLMIECWTDNINRTLNNVREILTDRGARMAPVKFMFDRLGQVRLVLKADSSSTTALEDKIFDVGLANGATDLPERHEDEFGSFYIYDFNCRPEDLNALADALRACIGNEPDMEVQSTELIYAPLEEQTLDQSTQEQVEELIRALEADPDTSRVWSTTCISS